MMRFALVILMFPACLQQAAAADGQQEIRFCPADVARTYPLDSRERVQSLVAPHIAVINRANAPLEVSSIAVELLDGQQVVDARHFSAADVERFASNSPGIREAMQAVPFMFCGTNLVGPGIKLAGPVLHANEGIVIASQVFAFNGRRDALRVLVTGTSAGGRPTQLSATLPITSDFSKTTWRFPLRGVSYVGWGASLHNAHRWVLPEAYGLDIARLGESGLTYRGGGMRFTDYYAYGTEIYAAAAGKVIESANDVPEDQALLQRPNESIDAYTARVQENQAKLMKSEHGVTGNYVIIDHGNREYSLYAHMQPGSVRVRPGDSVAAGELLGRLGSSGNSTEPHLHFHVCNGPSALDCNGMPVRFGDIKVLWAETERALQSGDIVIAK
jgi:murein DD-endopeptidase MepM/ murein hydrolase activator NlpD